MTCIKKDLMKPVMEKYILDLSFNIEVGYAVEKIKCNSISSKAERIVFVKDSQRAFI